MLDKDALRFILKLQNVPNLNLRLKRTAVEHWTPDAFQVIMEDGTKELREIIIWNCLFSPNIPPIVQRAAVDLRVSDRSDCVWQAVLRIHAIIPSLGESRRLAKCDKNATALIRLTYEGRTVRDMCDALGWMLSENNDIAKRWETGSRPDHRRETMFVVRSFVLDRFRRFCSCVVFEYPRDELTPELVEVLLMIIGYGNTARAVGCVLWFIGRWGSDLDLKTAANTFWRKFSLVGCTQGHFDEGREEYGVCMLLLRERLHAMQDEIDNDEEPIRSLYLLLNLYLEHPNAGQFDDPLSTVDGIKKLAKRLENPMLQSMMMRLLALNRLELFARLVARDNDNTKIILAWLSLGQFDNMQRLVELLLERDTLFPDALHMVRLTLTAFNAVEIRLMDQLDALSVKYGTPIIFPDSDESDSDSVLESLLGSVSDSNSDLDSDSESLFDVAFESTPLSF